MNIRQLARRLLVPGLFGLALAVAPASASTVPASQSGIAAVGATTVTPPMLAAAAATPLVLAQYYEPWPRYRRPRWDRPRYRRPPPRRDYRPRRAGSRHVRWCLNRYRSYNPRTDQYLGYDGRYHYCRSPFR
ncbi:BA14K family protein [Breoghania sp. L-A4]|uniref:BA14K family protein n=1 Tax=Breoghania sp. L-A4 TaxID=2304600 RepID=UPI000E3597BA|nr:BA14K family protein [Breoghania sp. L-A4]AXS39530.1 BA14K family protein [Breoghania sp. L-A4]